MARVLYIDIDTQRPDHLGCYGYHRDTSPTIDLIAAEGLRFDRVYVSDSPCLPSRSALATGQFGVRNGAINHGGARSEPWPASPERGFVSELANTSFAARMAKAGHRTATISSFAARHSALHWLVGFDEWRNPGRGGMERADEVGPIAIDWLERNARSEDWFCHVHFWDPHTPYRVPADYGDPFAADPIPSWYTPDVWESHRRYAHGPHSTYEVMGFEPEPAYLGGADGYPRQPRVLPSWDDARAIFDGYDTGVRYADDWIARLCNVLADAGVWDDVGVVVTSDHGETLGELGIYCDHQTADQHTNRVPFVLRWPGVTTPGSVDDGLHYQIDAAATVVELAGGTIPDSWDGQSFAPAIESGRDPDPRPYLVLSQAAWTCQRSVRWDDHLLMTTRHDGFHLLPPELLFDVATDPHELTDLAPDKPELVADGLELLARWTSEAMARSPHPDPMAEVLAEGGPFHCRHQLDGYLERLRETGRGDFADGLIERHR